MSTTPHYVDDMLRHRTDSERKNRQNVSNSDPVKSGELVRTREVYSCLFAVVFGLLLQLATGQSNITVSRNRDNNTILLGFLPAIRNNNGETKYIPGALMYAIQQINEDPTLLPGMTLQFKHEDNEGNSKVSIEKVIKMSCVDEVDAFIGPENTCKTEAHIAASLNKPMIAYKCREGELEQERYEEAYSTFARTLPSTSKVSKSVIALIRHLHWKSCSIVYQNTEPWSQTARDLAQLAAQKSVWVNHMKQFPELPVKSDELAQLLRDTVDTTRIYVFLGEIEAMMLFAREMRLMTIRGQVTRGQHVLITVYEDPLDNEYFYKDIVDHYKCSDHSNPIECKTNLEALTMEAYESVLMIVPKKPTNLGYTNFTDETRERSQLPPFKAPRLPDIPGLEMVTIKIPIFAAYLYDAVRLYAQAVNDTIAEGGDYRNGLTVINKIRNSNYRSIQGFDVRIDDDGDAEANYTVLQVRNQELHNVAHFDQRNGTPKLVEDGPFKWVGGDAPISDPECGFHNELCQHETDWLTPVICVGVATALLIVAVFALRHYLYEQKLASLLWKIDYKELLMTNPETDPTWSERTKRKGYARLSFLGLSDQSEDIKPDKNANLRLASYKGAIVAVKMLRKRHVEMTRSLRKELHVMKELSHDNINRFVGACVDPPNVCLVTQYCSRGSLKDILENEDLRLDDMFIASLVMDLIKGMIYLHDTEIGSHGNLRSSNCLVDSRWVLQISDFGLHQLKSRESPTSLRDENAYYQKLVYKAPELLRDSDAPVQGTAKGDIYSFGLILYETHCRAGPWGYCKYSDREIVEMVKKTPLDDAPFRPNTSGLRCEEFVVRCMQECWVEEYELRPDFKYTKLRLKPMQKGFRSNIFDQMLSIMEKYANNLEALVEDRTLQLVEEKKKTESLLLRMLPCSIAEQLKLGKNVEPEQYQCVTIYFSDIVGFTALSAESTPMQVVSLLNDLYTLFDSVIEEYDVYKVETIGDAYMVVSGLPIRNGYNHAGEIASMSLHLLRAIKNFRIRHMADETIKLRIGVHSGPCVAGVVGSKMPRYCLFGDTVNTASRMESTGVPLKIHCSPNCRGILDALGGYLLEDRGLVNMKGKGEVYTYFLTGEDRSHRLRRISTAVDIFKRTNPPNGTQRISSTNDARPALYGGPSGWSYLSLSDSSSEDEKVPIGAEEDEESSPKTTLLNGAAHFVVDLETRESVL